MPTYILDLIQDAEVLRHDIEKIGESCVNVKVKVWLTIAIGNAEQTLACLLHAQKQLEE